MWSMQTLIRHQRSQPGRTIWSDVSRKAGVGVATYRQEQGGEDVDQGHTENVHIETNAWGEINHSIVSFQQ